MRYNFLANNPFYLLEVLTSDSRSKIIKNAEEKAFLSDNNIYFDAQTILLNPNKRLNAELDWFLNVSDGEIQKIFYYIESCEKIKLKDLNGLTKLNVEVYNFLIDENIDCKEIAQTIFNIDESFKELNTPETCLCINENRKRSGIREVSDIEFLDALNKKRESIRLIITEKLQKIDEDKYIELVTRIAEHCAKYHLNSIVALDVTDQYEVRMQTTIEKSTEDIISHIARIKNNTEDEGIKLNLKGFINRIKKWDKLVQPLQIKSMLSGMPHEISEKLGREIRDFAIWLHNEKNLTEEAYEVVNEMQRIFKEIGSLLDVFNKDNEVLRSIITEKHLEEELESFESIAKNIKRNFYSRNIDSFFEKFETLMRTLKESTINNEEKEKLEELLCFIARDIAIFMYNEHKELELSKKLFSKILELSEGLYLVQTKVASDLLTLTSISLTTPKPLYQTNHSSAYQFEESSKSKWIWIIIGVCLLLIIFGNISKHGSNDDSSSYVAPDSYEENYSDENDYEETTTEYVEKRFSQNCYNYQDVYIKITSIEPSIGISYEGIGTNTAVACKAKTPKGKTVWIYMSVNEYNNHFDSDADINVSFGAKFKTVYFSNPKKIHGCAREADDLCEGLSDNTTKMVLQFESIE